MRQIHLDTNALIALSNPADQLFQYVEAAVQAGTQISTSVVAWHEYMCGPLNEQDKDWTIRIIESHIYLLERLSAELAAELYNHSGRRRGSTPNCLIAAIAIEHKAELLTRNLTDFRPFTDYGLKLIEPT